MSARARDQRFPAAQIERDGDASLQAAALQGESGDDIGNGQLPAVAGGRDHDVWAFRHRCLVRLHLLRCNQLSGIATPPRRRVSDVAGIQRRGVISRISARELPT